MYQLKEDGSLDTLPVFKKEALMDLANVNRPRQKGGVLQISHDGKYLYAANRADKTMRVNTKDVFAGGENNIAVFAIDQQTGEPTLIQHIDTHGIEARTFKIDPTGKLLVIANQKSIWLREGDKLNFVRSNLALFQIAKNGTLQFIRKYEVEDTRKWLLWMDIYSGAT